MILISDDAPAEAARLGKQSFPIKPMKLSEAMVKKTTSIDGALLLDRDANCHSIGVILDGLASDKGDPARGARYNSAIRYYEQFKGLKAMALVIISEDGMINLLPDLIPQIKHRDIEDAIESFNDILEQEELDRKSFNRGMSYFRSMNFFLTQQECNTINEHRKLIESKFETDLKMMSIVYNDLQPNAEMNDSYYVETNQA
jgi:hypothetical protein